LIKAIYYSILYKLNVLCQHAKSRISSGGNYISAKNCCKKLGIINNVATKKIFFRYSIDNKSILEYNKKQY